MNTQNIFVGALVPAAILICLSAWWLGRRHGADAPSGAAPLTDDEARRIMERQLHRNDTDVREPPAAHEGH